MNLLYPAVTFDIDSATQNPNALPPGNLGLILIDMTSVGMIQLAVSQISMTEDFSMRMWISVLPNGMPIPHDRLFPVPRLAARFVVYSSGELPANSIGVLVTPGRYYLNLLNLTNSANLFGFKYTILS